jgi:hypothetical protein
MPRILAIAERSRASCLTLSMNQGVPFFRNDGRRSCENAFAELSRIQGGDYHRLHACGSAHRAIGYLGFHEPSSTRSCHSLPKARVVTDGVGIAALGRASVGRGVG